LTRENGLEMDDMVSNFIQWNKRHLDDPYEQSSTMYAIDNLDNAMGFLTYPKNKFHNLVKFLKTNVSKQCHVRNKRKW
jgi:hypothetical protein